jgi:hypothetical protein
MGSFACLLSRSQWVRIPPSQLTARCVRRCGLPFKQAEMGSTPIRATDGRVAEMADALRSDRSVPCGRAGSTPAPATVGHPRSVAEARDSAKVVVQVQLLTRILLFGGASPRRRRTHEAGEAQTG